MAEWIKNMFTLQWVQDHLLYFGFLFLVVIIVQGIIILRTWEKDINKIEKNSRKSIIKLMRETSLKKKKERKQLKF